MPIGWPAHQGFFYLIPILSQQCSILANGEIAVRGYHHDSYLISLQDCLLR